MIFVSFLLMECNFDITAQFLILICFLFFCVVNKLILYNHSTIFLFDLLLFFFYVLYEFSFFETLEEGLEWLRGFAYDIDMEALAIHQNAVAAKR